MSGEILFILITGGPDWWGGMCQGCVCQLSFIPCCPSCCYLPHHHQDWLWFLASQTWHCNTCKCLNVKECRVRFSRCSHLRFTVLFSLVFSYCSSPNIFPLRFSFFPPASAGFNLTSRCGDWLTSEWAVYWMQGKQIAAWRVSRVV